MATNNLPVELSVFPAERIGGRRLWLIVGLVLFITGTTIAVDWMNYLYDLHSVYPAFANPIISLLCAAIAFGATTGSPIFVGAGTRSALSRKDARLLRSAFVCILAADLAMSLYVYSKNPYTSLLTFLVVAGLAIVVQGILTIRHSRGFAFLRQAAGGEKKSLGYRLGFPLAFYVPITLIFIFLSPWLSKERQSWPALFYTLLLATSLWVAWETVRQKLFPRPNALLIALGMTSWFLCELAGMLHYMDLRTISDISLIFVWVFYVPAILLLALSGYRWEKRS